MSGNFSTFRSPRIPNVFNSLGGWASVNHLHFHGIFRGAFPIEAAPVREISKSRGGCEIRRIDYPAECLLFRCESSEVLAGDVWNVVCELLIGDIPHNLLICEGGRTVYVIPRKVQEVVSFEFSELGGGIHVALAELCGYVICFDEATYAGIDECMYVQAIKDRISESRELIDELVRLVCEELVLAETRKK